MTVTIDDEVGEQLEHLAAEQGREVGDVIADLLKRTAQNGNGTSRGAHGTQAGSYSWPALDRTNGGIQPGFIADPQARMAAYLASSWPGDETEEEMQALADSIDD